MSNVTQQNSYHDKLAQILSERVLADFDNFSMEETSEGFTLRIPKSFFKKQPFDIDEHKLRKNKMKFIKQLYYW